MLVEQTARKHWFNVKAVQIWVELRPLLTSGRSVTVTYEIVRSGF
jgi:hypothetical protein